MSRESVKLFFEKVREDEDLQGKMKELYSENQLRLQESIIKLGAESGCNFSAEDMQQLAQETAVMMQKNEELDDAQLEEVAGGGLELLPPDVKMSIITIGFGCAASAIHDAAEKDGCLLW